MSDAIVFAKIQPDGSFEICEVRTAGFEKRGDEWYLVLTKDGDEIASAKVPMCDGGRFPEVTTRYQHGEDGPIEFEWGPPSIFSIG